MIEPGTRLLAGLLALLVTAPQATPQTAPGGPPTHHVVMGKTGKPGNSRSSPPPGSRSSASRGLCFQPGVGWQSDLTERPSEAATRNTGTSIGLDIGGSAGRANPKSVYARLSSAKQADAVQCAAILTEKRAPEAEVGKFTILDHSSAIRSAGSTKPGSVVPLQASLPFHPSGSEGLKPVWMTPSATPSAAKYLGSETGPGEPADEMNGRAFHAYISSIKLRKAIRSAPDFRTRIKLEQLQNDPAMKRHNAGPHTKTARMAKRSKESKRIDPTSSLRSDVQDRSRDNHRSSTRTQ